MPGKILLIDGDSAFVSELNEALTSKGYECSINSTAKEGLETLKSGSFNGVILEIMLEDVSSGFRIAKYIKQESCNPETAVLMVSAMKELTELDFSERIKNGELPVDQLLHKPVGVDVIVDALENIIGSS